MSNPGYAIHIFCRSCIVNCPCTYTIRNKTKLSYQYYLVYFLAPEGPPLNVQVSAESSSSLSVTWEEPEKDKRNGIIVNYTVCISQEESKPCFKEYTTKENMADIGGLNASTKYYVRVLASTKVGRGNYSESTKTFTNGSKFCRVYHFHINVTKSTLLQM